MGKVKRSANTSASAGNAAVASATIALTNGFLAVPVTVSTHAKHWIYVRKHTASAGPSTSKLEAELPVDRTMFVANLPVDATQDGLREMFGKVGGVVSSVRFRRARGRGEGEEEEDEKEELGEGENEKEQDEEEHHMLTKKRKKGVVKSPKSRVPKVIHLPSMDPRVAAGAEELLSTASSAHVVFLDTISLTRAMDHLASLSSPLKLPRQTSATTGLNYLLTQHTLSRPPLPTIASFANSLISLYQYRKAHPLPRRIGVRGVTLGPSGELLDEDGFIIVQRSGKYGRAGAAADAGGSVGVAKAGFVENTNKKSQGLEDFYRFQFREKKREQLAEMRRKFEEDKAKVAKLKQGRRFKPY